MNGLLHKLITVITILIVVFSQVFAQKISHRIDQFELVPGLPAKLVTSVFKDSRGFLWFGTENGLYRWDGYEYKEFHHDPGDSASISGNFIWVSFFEDAEKNLWIGTMSSGLNIYDPHSERFRHFSRKADFTFDFDYNQLYRGMEDRDGEKWFSSEIASGLVNFNENSGSYTIYRPDKDSIASYKNAISVIYEDNGGKLWIGTWRGLFIFDKKTRDFTNLGSLVSIPEIFSEYPITSIIEDESGIIWIGSNTGLYKYDPAGAKIIRYYHKEDDPQSLCSDFIMRVYDNALDGGTSLWIITRLGINKFDKTTGKVTRYGNDPKDPLTIAFDAIFSMFLDDNGILWAGTGFAGAVKYNLNPNPFSTYHIGPFENEPYKYEGTAFLADKEGYFWVGTANGGLFRYDKNMNLVTRYTSNPNNSNDPNHLSYRYIYSIMEDSDGIIWLGTAATLDAFDKKSDRFLHITMPAEIDFSYIRVNEMIEDKTKTLWFATNSGVYYLDKRSRLDTSLQRVITFKGNMIDYRCITEDQHGNIWIGTLGEGVYLLKPENRNTLAFENLRNTYGDPNSLSDNLVQCIFVDREGILWVGTPNGLNRYNADNQSFYRFNHSNGLDATFIYNIVEDNSGNLWLSTEKGIIRFTLLTDTTAHSKLLERSDGLPFEDNYQFKIYKSPEGKIYVGGRRMSGDGFYCFDPDSLRDNRNIPPIVLTELMIKNKPAELDTSITELTHLPLRYNQNYFSLKFAALDFVNPARNNYAYILEGFDDDWIYSDNRRLANYTNVPPGDYIFRVKGSNNDGVWNETGTSLQISIASPPWKTGWAYLLYVIIVLLIFYVILKTYLNRQKLVHDLELKHLEAAKLEELSQEKSKFFANISHEFRTPLTLIIGPVKKAIALLKDDEIREELQMTLRNALRLQNLINQLLSLAKLESGKMELLAKEEDIVALVRGYFQSFESAAREKHIELKLTSDEPEIRVFVDRDKLEKILYNLFSNSLKFTPEGGEIELAVGSRQSAVGSQYSLHTSQRSKVKGQNMTADRRLPIADLKDKHLTLTITDTGPGISPEHLPHIFDRFYQVDDSLTRDQEGSGIGLALVKELVELHHGEITVESEVGKGTTFRIMLPLGREHLGEEEVEKSQQTTPTPALPQIGGGSQEGGEALLLIVEDNADMRSYLRSCLGNGYKIIEASNGEKGLAKALENIPDLIISDVMMPKMDGYELCKRIKSDEKTSHIPVILLTARATMESKIEGLETGADDFVSKPFDALELQVRVRNLITQRRKLTEKFMKNASQLGFTKILAFPETGMTSMEDRFLQRSLEIVNENLADPDFGVEKFSDQMAMSRSQLYRKLHALTNLSPNEFIRFTRLHKAAEMLRHHTANVAGIAYDVGFNNPSYFAECFRKEFGVLPSEYK